MADTEVAPTSPRPQPLRRLIDIARLCVVEARPSVLLVFLLRFLVGSALSGIAAPRGDLGRIAAAAVVWELAVFAVYLFNGVTDVQEDRINGSRRPIARGALPTATARRITVGAAALSLIGGATLGGGLFWAVLALLTLGFCYSSPLVQLKRHAITSTLTGLSLGLLTYYAGHLAYAAAGSSYPGPEFVVFVAAVTTWMGLVGGLTKDLSDVAGDAAAGRRTVAGVHGEAAARRAAAGAALGLAVAFCAAGVWTSPLLIWPGLAMLGGAIAITIVCLGGSAKRAESDSRRPYRAFMATQYLMNLGMIVALGGQLLFG
ncbi:UbiA family prenyltransferase [Micromonospora sp. PLK6-60]|uniref:UbiA family prenyltransferase n=1 Tax=Micromonospora sp. PLK6-60 TaxID=2873383 RepID=UPI001CA627DA|nr:UbiA family prenyltransferase [Micromonospora sp. PLK6-60]MBY8870800.1 UbiA family prenyltransferase [Micromonospora sp. PLK6-60]